MTARDLLTYEIGHIGTQLKAACGNLPEDVHDKKLCDEGMTPRVVLEHLCEVYQAVLTESSGGKHEWGSFVVPDKSWDNLTITLWSMREAATKAVTTQDNDELVKSGFNYIVAHDAYHVGQLALIRIQHEPGWDPYSIYAE